MSLIRLDPFIYLYTPLGLAEAHFLARETFEVPYSWGCFQAETKENWWWANQHVRLCESVSAGRDGSHTPIFLDEEMFDTLRPHILRHTTSPFFDRAQRIVPR